MSIYLDVSVIVPLFVIDPLNQRADRALRKLRDNILISDFSAA